MYQVTVYPVQMTAHISQVFAGLDDLQGMSEVSMRFSDSAPPAYCVDLPHILVIDVASAKHSRAMRVCLDLRDQADIVLEALVEADLYLKRTYVVKRVAALNAAARAKVRPFGLNFACRGNRPTQRIRQAGNRIALSPRSASSWWDTARGILTTSAGRFKNSRHASMSTPLKRSAYELTAASLAEPRVTFFTRVWAQQDAPESDPVFLDAINDNRAEIIRALREALGDRFVGGLTASELAHARYPDCVVESDTSKLSYLKAMQEGLIGIATTGLHQSTGWKIAEYIAASRCVVSEPLTSCLPDPLREGKNLLTFRSPSECVIACQRLLSDPELANSMRRHNAAYYRQRLRADVLMRKHLQSAVACPS